MANTKLNVYKIVLQKVCQKFSGVENILRKELKSYVTKKKLSAEEVSYLFTNNKFC